MLQWRGGKPKSANAQLWQFTSTYRWILVLGAPRESLAGPAPPGIVRSANRDEHEQHVFTGMNILQNAFYSRKHFYKILQLRNGFSHLILSH